MNYRKLLVVLICLIGLPLYAKTKPPRSDRSRYLFLHDQQKVDRALQSLPHESIFQLELGLSSGLRDLVDEVQNISDDSSKGTLQKQLDVIEALSQHLNTEKYLNLYIEAGIPLPVVKIKQHKLVTSLFASFDAGLSLSISNFNNALDPNAQTYLLLDQKFGTSFKYQPSDHRHLFIMTPYLLRRSDLHVDVTTTEIANDGKIFDINDVKIFNDRYLVDLGYIYKAEKQVSFHAQLEEITIGKKAPKRTISHHNNAFFNVFVKKEIERKKLKVIPLAGMHAGSTYKATNGLYGGLSLDYSGHIPVFINSKLDMFFFSLSAGIKFKYFQAKYTTKIPHTNPQYDMWVPATHFITFNFPFP